VRLGFNFRFVSENRSAHARDYYAHYVTSSSRSALKFCSVCGDQKGGVETRKSTGSASQQRSAHHSTRAREGDKAAGLKVQSSVVFLCPIFAARQQIPKLGSFAAVHPRPAFIDELDHAEIGKHGGDVVRL